MGQILWDIVIQPLMYFIEIVFASFWAAFHSAGISIILVSIAVNVLCLPLYKMADDAQERERQKQAQMEPVVSHIRKTFSGDERYMMLSAYYLEQGYRPIQALVSSLSLLLQIPFFIAAYTYLSHLQLLRGSSFLFLSDLSTPDALLTIGGITINVLPIVMTLLNCASTAVYTRGRPLRDKLQAYLLAALFLVLLYDSPSGLVFYWTCNQIFSLGKNVVMKLIRSRQARTAKAEAKADAKAKPKKEPRAGQPTDRLVVGQFLLACALLTALLGVLIPSAVMADSPTEFVDILNGAPSPLAHVVHTVCTWGGVWFVWTGIYFALSSKAGRRHFSRTLWCLCGVFLLDHFCFGRGLGVMSNQFVFDTAPSYPDLELLVNALAIVALVLALLFVWRMANPVVAPALALVFLSLLVVSVPNLVDIARAHATMRDQVARNAALLEKDSEEKQTVTLSGTATTSTGTLFHLSRTERNVLVIFLDRAISGYLPYIMNERPELVQQFDGFTYYPNTISFGTCTNFGAPALYGGYEYTPAAMNARADELISDKHNEALLVLPTLFSEAGYTSTVVDPPYAGNYSWYPDLSLYKDIDGCQAFYNDGRFLKDVEERYGFSVPYDANHAFFMFGLFRVSPELIHNFVYSDGAYLSASAIGVASRSLLAQYGMLMELPELSEVTDGSGTFVQLGNTATHEPALLQLPDYTPASNVDNVGLEDPSRFTLNGRTVRMDTFERLAHYHVNISTLMQLGQWFDWMRSQGVYDNTRIIIVADHGFTLSQFEGWEIDKHMDIEMVNPLFMVKDFDAHGFTTSNEFMTNADTVPIAVADIMEDPRNPFTGNRLTSDAKNAHEQLISGSRQWVTNRNDGKTFDSSDAPWYAVSTNIFDLNNWRVIEDRDLK